MRDPYRNGGNGDQHANEGGGIDSIAREETHHTKKKKVLEDLQRKSFGYLRGIGEVGVSRDTYRREEPASFA